MEQQLLTTQEAADMLNVSLRTVRAMIERRDNDDWLFTGHHGKRLNVDNWHTRHFTPAAPTLEFREGPREYVTPHWLRHTAATTLLKAGVNPGAICSQLGWSYIATFYAIHAGFFSEDAGDVIKAQRDAWTVVQA